jgi:hypothetical protein
MVIIQAPNNRLETRLTRIPEIIEVLAVIQDDQIIEIFHSQL